MQNLINKHLFRVIIFLIIIVIIVFYLYPVLSKAFFSNIYINSTIILSLIFGIIYSIINLVNIRNDHLIISKFSQTKTYLKSTV